MNQQWEKWKGCEALSVSLDYGNGLSRHTRPIITARARDCLCVWEKNSGPDARNAVA